MPKDQMSAGSAWGLWRIISGGIQKGCRESGLASSRGRKGATREEAEPSSTCEEGNEGVGADGANHVNDWALREV